MKKNRMISGGLILGLMIFLLGVSNMDEKRDVFTGKNFILQGHRGLSNRYPENTVVSFQAAASSEEYQGIETDVQETKDGVLVLFHDSKLDKKTDAKGKISSYTFDEVRQITIKHVKNIENYPGEKIPVLEDYLDICRHSGKIPYIELKSLTEEGTKKLIDVLDHGGWQGRCVITSFHKELIALFRNFNQLYPIEYMIDENYDIEEVIDYLSQYENMSFRPNAYRVTEEDVKKCNIQNIRVECFGLEVGDKEQLKYLKKIGVKGVTCNDFKGL